MHAKARHAQGRSTKGKEFLRPHLEDMIYEGGAQAKSKEFLRPHLEDMIYEDFDDDVAMPGIVWKAMLGCVMIFFRIRG